jgi:hypothetical protein
LDNKTVEPRKKGGSRGEKQSVTVEIPDHNELIAMPAAATLPDVDPQNLVADTLKIWTQITDHNNISEVHQRIFDAVVERISHSFGDLAYEDILNALGIWQTKANEFEDEEIFGKYAKELAKGLQNDKYGANHGVLYEFMEEKEFI